MSRIDGYEAQRGPIYRRKRRHVPVDTKRAKQEAQLAIKLYGGATRTEIAEGEPFNDSIEHIGR